MKIVLTGSLGNISKPLTSMLVEQGHTVTVISSNAEKKTDIEALGANAAIGSVTDGIFLTATLTGVDAVYLMVPPNYHRDSSLKPVEFYRHVGQLYAKAIREAGVKRVIHLSSMGAHLAEGTGIVLGHYVVENILKELPGISLTHLRPTAFYYNLYNFIARIKRDGVIAANYGDQDVLPWVSPLDIAAAVADELATIIHGRKIRYVCSDEPSCNEVAGVLGSAIGIPDLKWIVIPDEQMQRGLEASGVPKDAATGLVEINASIHKGLFTEDYFKNRPAVMGNVKIADFARDFAAAFHKAV